MYQFIEKAFTSIIVCLPYLSFFYFLTWGHFFIAFRERERERETSMWERNINWLASCTHPDRGLNPQPGHVPWLGTEPATFRSMGQCSNQLSHPARAVVPHSYETGISISPMWQVNPGNIDILRNSLLWGAVLGTVGCLAAFQSSAH